MSVRKGFTLVELLVAMTVFSVVMTAVYTGFNTGTRMWRRGETDMQAFQDARVALALISKELRCAFPEAGHFFYGEDDRSGERETDRVEFFAVRPPMEPEKGHEARIMKIAYYIDKARGGHGYVLEREERIVSGKIPTEEEVANEEREEKHIKMGKPWRCVIATDVGSLDFQYLWGTEWVPFCERGFGLPACVRIALTLESEGKRADARRFESAVRIPLGYGPGPPPKERV